MLARTVVEPAERISDFGDSASRLRPHSTRLVAQQRTASSGRSASRRYSVAFASSPPHPRGREQQQSRQSNNEHQHGNDQTEHLRASKSAPRIPASAQCCDAPGQGRGSWSASRIGSVTIRKPIASRARSANTRGPTAGFSGRRARGCRPRRSGSTPANRSPLQTSHPPDLLSPHQGIEQPRLLDPGREDPRAGNHVVALLRLHAPHPKRSGREKQGAPPERTPPLC